MEIEIDDLYKVLRFHDLEIRKHFNDDSYSDSDYFFCAINEDIFQNAINIINNVKAGFALSPSIDNSCRTIIESFCILKMRAEGVISDEQLKLFRNQYLLVDFLNLKQAIKESDSPYKDGIIKGYKETIQLFCDYYKCKEKDLLASSVDDPNFYLKRSLKDNIRFKSLLKKFPVFDEAKYGLYDFFSIFSHPFFTFDKEAYIRLMSNRDEMIDMVLDYVLKYICNSSLWINDCKEMSFEDIFTNNPILENNRKNILSLNVLFENTINKSCYFDDGCDLCRIMYLQKINDLIGSMMVNFAIGYREQVIVDFKNFIELSAVDSYLGHCDSISEYKTLKKAFDVTTLLSICNISGLLNEQSDKKYFEKEMRELYEKFYKERYQLNDFEEFYSNVVNNSLYFIFKDKKSYKSVVRKMFDDIYYLNQDLSKSIYATFQIANDFAHAGGYSFNASPGMVDDCATKVLCFVLLHLKIVLINIIEVSKEHNKTVEFDQEFKYINDMMEYYTEINEKIEKDYSTKLN